MHSHSLRQTVNKCLVLMGLSCLAVTSANAQFSDIALSDRASLLCGLADDGQVNCSHAGYRTPEAVNGEPGQTYTMVESNGSGLNFWYACGLTTSEEIKCWSSGIPEESVDLLSPPQFDHPVVQMSLGSSAACAVDSMGDAQCWGPREALADLPDRQLPKEGRNYTQVVAGQASGSQSVCALGDDGVLDCWGVAAGGLQPPDNLLLSHLAGRAGNVACGIDQAGDGHCWRTVNSETNSFLTFTNGPYVDMSVATVFDSQQRKSIYFACALTSNGELDCANSDVTGENRIMERKPDLYKAVEDTYAEICGYTLDNRLNCFAPYAEIRSRAQTLQDLINSELSMPSPELTEAHFYGDSVELIYEASGGAGGFYQFFFDTEIYRDGEYLITVDNKSSYIDTTVEAGQTYSYQLRPVHLYGQVGELSNALSVTTTLTQAPLTSNTSPVRPYRPSGLRAEIYWFDIELFWDRDTSGAVKNYEIRKNGEFISTTRGTSFYDNTTSSGEVYVYDVIAVGHNDEILGFRSEHVLIGEAHCQ